MTEELVREFCEVAEANFPEMDAGAGAETLRAEIKRRKYDLQDEALMEAALRNERDEFVSSFLEALERRLEKEKDRKAFFLSERGRYEVVSLFVSGADDTIDHYYNALIGKHFSSS